MTADDAVPEAEIQIDPDFGSQYMAQQDEIHRHIGAVVRNAAELEDVVSTLITWIIDDKAPARVRPLVQGRRLSELIATLKIVLPEYSDKAGMIKALRTVNDHRDRIAHSTAGTDLEVGEFLNLGVHRIDRQARTDRTSLRLDVAAFRAVEHDHTLVRRALFLLVVQRNLRLLGSSDTAADPETAPERAPEPGSILEILRRMAPDFEPTFLGDDELGRLEAILAGAPLLVGFSEA